MVSVCVPVLKRYDLLAWLVESMNASSVCPDRLFVIDNGKCPSDTFYALSRRREQITIDVLEPDEPMGVAESWNWFIRNTKEERFILNDDVTLGRHSLRQMLATPGDFVSGLADHNAFSCFLIRDSCVSQVGFFDEEISPGYGYFEDLDYRERMLQVGLRITPCVCDVKHGGSQTIKMMTGVELQQHHRRFVVAQENYIRKWGRLPDGVARQL